MSISPQGGGNQPLPPIVPMTREEFQAAADEVAEAGVNISLCVGAFAKYKFEYFPIQEIARILVEAGQRLQNACYLMNVQILPYAPPDPDDDPEDYDLSPLVPGPILPPNATKGGAA